MILRRGRGWLVALAACAACGSNPASGGDASPRDDAATALDAGAADSGGDAAIESGTVDAATTCGANPCREGQTCVAGACEYQACAGQKVPGDYATLGAAMAALASTGGTICLGVSTYVETPSSNAYQVGAPITIQGVSAAKSIVRVERLLYVDASADFTIRGVALSKIDEPDGGVDNYRGPLSYFSSNGSTLTVEDSAIAGNSNEFGAAILFSGGGLTVRASTLTGAAQGAVWVFASNGTVLLDGDDISSPKGPAVYVEDSGTNGTWTPTITVQNSYLHDSAAGISYDDATIYGGLLNATLVVDNDTFVHDTTAIDVSGSEKSKVTLTYFNDVFAQDGTAVSIVTTTAATVSSGFNLFFGNTTNFAGSALDGPSDVKADPLLAGVPPAPGAGSPALGAGDPNHAPANDYWGAPRGASIDLGCVE